MKAKKYYYIIDRSSFRFRNPGGWTNYIERALKFPEDKVFYFLSKQRNAMISPIEDHQ